MIPPGFQWDEAKRLSNLEKHGIDFRDAVRIFQGPTLGREDIRGPHAEIRTNSIGAVDGVAIVNVTHTERDGTIRLISARPANRAERCVYESFRRGLAG